MEDADLLYIARDGLKAALPDGKSKGRSAFQNQGLLAAPSPASGPGGRAGSRPFAGWKACETAEGEMYYFNFNTGESSWDHPLDNHFKSLYQQKKASRLPPAAPVSGANADCLPRGADMPEGDRRNWE